MKKIVNGVEVDCTAEEIAQRQAEEYAYSISKPKADLKAQLSAIDSKLWAQRWAREGHLGLGELIDILRAVPSSITTVAELVAYLQAIPPCGTGMTKLRQIEEQAKELRSQLAALG